MSKRRVAIIIQVRMLSTRLPGKVMLPALGRPLLAFLLERVRRVPNVDTVVVATTEREEDTPIIDLCHSQEIAFFRGSEEDVLGRYLAAARAHSADVVVRITADCPLIDPDVVTQVLAFFLENNYDYVSNTLVRTYPRGMDVEVFSLQALERADLKAPKKSDREHVTLFMCRHPKAFRLGNLVYSTDMSGYRFTVDTKEDYKLVKEIVEGLYPAKPEFTLEDILDLLRKKPEMRQINAHIHQKTIEENNQL